MAVRADSAGPKLEFLASALVLSTGRGWNADRNLGSGWEIKSHSRHLVVPKADLGALLARTNHAV